MPMLAGFSVFHYRNEFGETCDSFAPKLLALVGLKHAIPEPKRNDCRGDDDQARQQKNRKDDSQPNSHFSAQFLSFRLVCKLNNCLRSLRRSPISSCALEFAYAKTSCH